MLSVESRTRVAKSSCCRRMKLLTKTSDSVMLSNYVHVRSRQRNYGFILEAFHESFIQVKCVMALPGEFIWKLYSSISSKGFLFSSLHAWSVSAFPCIRLFTFILI